MAKIKSQYVAKNCGYTTASGWGMSECGNWDSLAEEAVATEARLLFLT
jgi:predicted ATP-dependent serine protease